MWKLLLVFSLSFADTAVEDTAIEDTAIEDTADLGEDTADTAVEDTGSTTTTDTSSTTTDTTTATDSDTTDTSWVVPASSLANEKGGVGCSTVGIGGVLVIWIASFVIGFRKE